jgi:hypothetical protein
MIHMHIKFVSDDEVQQVATEYAAPERRSLMRAFRKKVGKTAKKTAMKTTKKTQRSR